MIEKLDADGLRDQVKVMVGGAPVTPEWADKIGADGYANNAPEAVEIARKLVGAARELGVERATVTTLSGPGGEVAIGDDHPFAIIGERINPTGRSALTRGAEGRRHDHGAAPTPSRRCEAGAAVLDLNAGIPGFDEPAMLVGRSSRRCTRSSTCRCASTRRLPRRSRPPCRSPQGKVLINSVTAEQHSLERLLPLVTRFGAAVIGMANDEEGISMDPRERLAAARRIVEAAADHGIAAQDVIIDPLTMPIGAAGDAATAMFETVRLIRDELGVNVSCGASNISFGMPDRQGIDAAFLTMSAMAGMNTRSRTRCTRRCAAPCSRATCCSGATRSARRGSPTIGRRRVPSHRPGAEAVSGRKLQVTLRAERHDRARADRARPCSTRRTGRASRSNRPAAGAAPAASARCGCSRAMPSARSPTTGTCREGLDEGWRLSCQCEVAEDMVVEVPRAMTVPKAATMGVGRFVLLEPNAVKHLLHARRRRRWRMHAAACAA